MKVFRSIYKIVLAGFILVLSGCAYFNTFYNARKYYNEGVRDEEAKAGGGKVEFKKSLEKVVVVAQDYPDSRWIDDAFFLIAMNYYWLGNYDKAKVQYEGFIELFSESPFVEEATFYYGKTLVALKQHADGRLVYTEMFASKKWGKQARYAWAEAFEDERDWDGAKQAFRQYLEVYPRGEMAHSARLQLAEIELAGGDTVSAIETYEKILRKAETSKENYARMLTLAELYFTNQEYKKAQKTLKKTKGRYAEIDQAADLLSAKIQLAQGDTARAGKLLAGIEPGDSRAEAFFILASVYEMAEEYPSALAYYDTVITRERRSDYSALAERKKTLLETRIMVADSTDTVQIDPASEQFLLAQAYFLSFGDIPRSIEEYRKVAAQYPESEYAPKALYGIGWIKRYRLEDTTWVAEMESLISSYPESPAAQEARLLLTGNIPEEDSIETNPD